MTDPRGVNDAPPTSSDEALDAVLRDPHAMDWMGEHMTELRRTVAEHRIRSQVLWIGLVLGLLAQAAGYLLRPPAAATAAPLGLLADLLYTLGLALWTGVVVVVMVEIIPKAKERQIKQSLDAYEASMRDRTATGRKEPPPHETTAQ